MHLSINLQMLNIICCFVCCCDAFLLIFLRLPSSTKFFIHKNLLLTNLLSNFLFFLYHDDILYKVKEVRVGCFFIFYLFFSLVFMQSTFTCFLLFYILKKNYLNNLAIHVPQACSQFSQIGKKENLKNTNSKIRVTFLLKALNRE